MNCPEIHWLKSTGAWPGISVLRVQNTSPRLKHETEQRMCSSCMFIDHFRPMHILYEVLRSSDRKDVLNKSINYYFNGVAR